MNPTTSPVRPEMSYADKAETIAYDLMGTCNSLQGALEARDWDGDDNVQEFCDRLDAIAFECLQCSWWFEQSEMSEDIDWTCDDCASE